jgi:hypothetical protein
MTTREFNGTSFSQDNIDPFRAARTYRSRGSRRGIS